MRSAASDSVAIALLFGMTAGSLWLKSRIHPAPESFAVGRIERAIANRLATHGFATHLTRLPLGSIVVDGRRGDCVVYGRSAVTAIGGESAFVQAAHSIGPIGYLYDGRRYAVRPTLRLRLARLWREAAHLVGINLPMKPLIAFAESPACAGNLFGLNDPDLITSTLARPSIDR